MKTFPLLTLLICLCAGPSQSATYTMHDFGTTMIPCAINNLGQVAGDMAEADGTDHAFIWQDGQTTDLGPGCAEGINDLGEVVGWSGTQNNGLPTIWQDGAVTTISGVNGNYGSALAIDNRGQVTGTTTDGSVTRAWIWQGGNLTDLGTMGASGSFPTAMNNTGQVIGFTVSSTGQWPPFIWQGGVMSSIPGLPEAMDVMAINDGGQIVGDDWVHEDGASWTEAFILQNGTETFLGNLCTPTDFWQLSCANGINNLGQVVGWTFCTGGSSSSDQPDHAFVWQDGVMTDLGTLGGSYSTAFAINDNSWIVGQSETTDGQIHGVLWTPVPEPSPMLGILTGLLLLFRRFRSLE